MSGGGNLSADRTITLSESPNSPAVVGTGRQVFTSGAAMSGGGDLSTDRTITLLGQFTGAPQDLPRVSRLLAPVMLEHPPAALSVQVLPLAGAVGLSAWVLLR